MTHVRQQIREAVATALTGLASTADRVHPSHVYDVQNKPALAIYTTEEEITETSMGRPVHQLRVLTLRVEALAEGPTVDDDLDEIAKEVEVAMQADRTFGNLVLDTALVQTEMTFSGEGNKPAGAARLTYELQYRTAENDPETIV